METPQSGNHVNGGRTRGGRGWKWRMDVLAATMIVAAVLPAACSAPGTASSSGAARSAAYQALAFAQCMRSHGAPGFPGPGPGGGFTLAGAQVNPHSPPFKHAAQVCGEIAPR